MVYEQGSSYEENTEPSEKEEKPAHKDMKHLPYILGAVLVVIILILIVATARKHTAVEPVVEETPSFIEVEGGSESAADLTPLFSYTEDERENLRAWGYTGDEIEAYEVEEVPAADLVEQSRQAQEAARATLSNPESPEYQQLLNSTWLGQPLVDLSGYTAEEAITEVCYNTLTLNADYEKLEAHGSNLFLKVWITENLCYFMECPLLRYLELPDHGNIVVKYQTLTLGDNVFICDMEEVLVE